MRSRLSAVFCLLVAAAACREQPLPQLTDALASGGTAPQRARQFMIVAIAGEPGDRAEAAFLWGLFACDAGSATAAVQAFSVAAPTGGLGRLAARRLQDCLQRSGGSPALWRRAAASAWLLPDERDELLVTAAERFGGTLPSDVILSMLPDVRALPDGLRLRALAVMGRLGGEPRQRALREVATRYPHRFADLFPSEPATSVVASLTPGERELRAAAWLAGGRASTAFREAAALGDRAAEIAARAALDLRRSQIAENWARRLGGTPAGLLLLAEAQRQQAWGTSPAARAVAFSRVVSTAGRLIAMGTRASDVMAEARLLRAEALGETGSFREAAELLAGPGPERPQRWEWVWRRLVYLQGRRGSPPVGVALADESGSVRGRRLAAYWAASTAAAPERSAGFGALVRSGFPDLPALWAARQLGQRGIAVELSENAPPAASPPPWASHLLDLGRVSDLIVAWRAELAGGTAEPSAWISLVQLAGYPTIDAIPLLLRGEPRLLAGPWSGLPRTLLESYLPLPFRAEVEAAAKAANMPPWILAGIVRQESAWNARARSPAGALGLTQILPSTAPDIARWSGRRDLLNRSLFDPPVNLTLGALHTAGWFRSYRSWTVALACHNAGERRVRDAWQAAGRSDGPEFVESLEIPETWDYVHRVVLWAEGYRLLYWPEGEPYPWT